MPNRNPLDEASRKTEPVGHLTRLVPIFNDDPAITPFAGVPNLSSVQRSFLRLLNISGNDIDTLLESSFSIQDLLHEAKTYNTDKLSPESISKLRIFKNFALNKSEKNLYYIPRSANNHRTYDIFWFALLTIACISFLTLSVIVASEMGVPFTDCSFQKLPTLVPFCCAFLSTIITLFIMPMSQYQRDLFYLQPIIIIFTPFLFLLVFVHMSNSHDVVYLLLIMSTCQAVTLICFVIYAGSLLESVDIFINPDSGAPMLAFLMIGLATATLMNFVDQCRGSEPIFGWLKYLLFAFSIIMFIVQCLYHRSGKELDEKTPSLLKKISKFMLHTFPIVVVAGLICGGFSSTPGLSATTNMSNNTSR